MKAALSAARSSAFVQRLLAVNSRFAAWVASMSWWRLFVLVIVLVIAGNLISEKLHLEHDHVGSRAKRVKRQAASEEESVSIKSSKDGESVVVKIGGREAVRITKDGPNAARVEIPPDAPKPPVPPGEPSTSGEGPSVQGAPTPGASGVASGAAPAIEPGNTPKAPPIVIAEDPDQESRAGPWRKVITARGLVGDLGASLMILLIAYLVAAKIIVRKVAESDAKVKSAQSAVERESMERQLVQARLQVLQAQVEPHFLFNTLAAVDFLIETDPPRASQMQKALIRYLRGALPQMRLDASTLGREVKLIEAYLDLIKMRIEDRLQVEFAIPEGLESAEFPPMMLQSLVENAIKHGIEPKPEGGKVSIAARIQNGLLWVEVSDTGVGLPNSDILDGPTTGTGIGLANIRERLAMLYPGKGRLTLRSDDATGTQVRIGVPYRVSAEGSQKGGEADA